MLGRRCRALSCWALALISLASFAILHTDPWKPRHQPQDIDGKSQQGNIDQEAFLENSGTLKHLGRNLDYNDELVDDIADDDDQELDYDVEGEGGLEEEAKKRKKAKNAKETAEEKKARRLRRLGSASCRNTSSAPLLRQAASCPSCPSWTWPSRGSSRRRKTTISGSRVLHRR